MVQPLFIGPRLRTLRRERGLKLKACAEALGLSPSYLSQIETNQRPVTERVLSKLLTLFGVDAAAFEADDDRRMVATLREATLDGAIGAPPAPFTEVRQAVATTPGLSRQFLALHGAYRRLAQRLTALDQAIALDEAAAVSALLPYEEVRDYFHDIDNYVDALDVAAEALAEALGIGAVLSPEEVLKRRLTERHGIAVDYRLDDGSGVLRAYDPASKAVVIDGSQPAATRAFLLAYQIAALEFGDLIETELAGADLKSAEARAVCRVGLTNYAAGALLLPYERFAAAAEAERHDLERLQLRFQASLEQVCHRLSTLQRPSQRGTPFYFVRVDMAGNITKRHSATRLQFARFGGACPLWNIHEAFGRPGEFLVQSAETPDGVRHLCVAVSVVKSTGSFGRPPRRYALGLGCEIQDAHKVVYADGLDLGRKAVPIGVSCRICERQDCSQRAFPALDRSLHVPENLREVVPYRLREPAR